MAGGKLARLTFLLTANSQQFKREMAKAEGAMGKFKAAMKSAVGVAGTALAAIGLSTVANDAFRLAAAGQGIRVAFARLNDPNLLNNLRAATQGTVSDLELMKAAVKASNFKIPLEQLGGLLAFAQQRALETGESVDYLVESIINGIARKSLPILDNLGLSAVEVRGEFEKTGDMAKAVGNIIARDMGEPIRTMQTDIDRFNAMIANTKEWIGVRLLKAVNAVRHSFNILKITLLAVRGGFAQLGEWAMAAGYAMAHPLQWKEIRKRFDEAKVNVASIDDKYQDLIRTVKAADAAMMSYGSTGGAGKGGGGIGFTIPEPTETTKKTPKEDPVKKQLEERAKSAERLKEREQLLMNAVNARAAAEESAIKISTGLKDADIQRAQSTLNLELATIGLSAATQMFNDVANVMALDQADRAEAFRDSMHKIVNSLIAQGVAAVVSNTIKNSSAVLGPLAIPLGAAAGAAASALFSAAVPKFAMGGIVPPGFPNDNYPALLSSGETVVPKPKALGAMSSNVKVTGAISGEVIRLSTARANYRYNRIVG